MAKKTTRKINGRDGRALQGHYDFFDWQLFVRGVGAGLGGFIKLAQIYLVDPASSHMLVPKIKTWMSQDAYFPMLGFPSSAQAELRAGKLGLLRHKNSP